MNFDVPKFEQEHCVEFQGSSGTLIAGWKLKELLSQVGSVQPLRQHDGLTQYKEPIPGHIYFTTCDVSRGKGLDYSTFHVFDCTAAPYEQVCTFQNNMMTPLDFSNIIINVCKMYNDAYVLVEVNDIGGQVVDALHVEYEYEHIIHTETAGRGGKRVSLGFKGTGHAQIERGIRTTKTVKGTGCALLKLIVEQNTVKLNNINTVHELTTFSKKNDSYAAEDGKHDDLVMALMLFAWLSDQQYFRDLTNLYTLEHMKEKSDEELIADMLPFGFVDNHMTDIEEQLERERSRDFWMWAGDYPQGDPY
jgi:hypothetical protein